MNELSVNALMVEEVTIIIAVVGLIIGSVSLIRQFWKERARFTCKIIKSFWFPPEKHLNSKWYSIAIEILVRNLGTQSTTIHHAKISFMYENKKYERSEELQIILESGHSTTHRFNFSFNERELIISKNPTNVTLEIEHTFNTIIEKIDEIPKL